MSLDLATLPSPVYGGGNISTYTLLLQGGITKRVLVLGLNRAGKTQLVRAFQQNSAPGEWLPALDSTKGCNIKSVKLGRYGLSIWDSK